jgi:NTE family protein
MTGALYELGALAALDQLFDPRASFDGQDRPFTVNDFDVYVGTSAGAFLATVLAGGIRAPRMLASVLDDDPSFFPIRRTDVYRSDIRQLLGVAKDVVEFSIGLLLKARKGTLTMGDIVTQLSDLLPAGIFSLRHYEQFLSTFLVHHGLPQGFGESRRELYITANDLDSGHRAIFGMGRLANAPIAKAICASSAIPLFFEPVHWDGRDYIDGAEGKVAHGDIAIERGARLLVVINPLVPYHNEPYREDLPSMFMGARHIRHKGMLAVFQQATKMSTRTKLHQELRRYRSAFPDTEILLIEPSEEDGDMFMRNPMSLEYRKQLLRYGYESARRALLAQLPRWRDAFARHGITVAPDRLRPSREAVR